MYYLQESSHSRQFILRYYGSLEIYGVAFFGVRMRQLLNSKNTHTSLYCKCISMRCVFIGACMYIGLAQSSVPCIAHVFCTTCISGPTRCTCFLLSGDLIYMVRRYRIRKC